MLVYSKTMIVTLSILYTLDYELALQTTEISMPGLHCLLSMAIALRPSPPVRRVAPSPFTAGTHAAHHTADAKFRAWPALNNETTRHAVNAGYPHGLNPGVAASFLFLP